MIIFITITARGQDGTDLRLEEFRPRGVVGGLGGAGRDRRADHQDDKRPGARDCRPGPSLSPAGARSFRISRPVVMIRHGAGLPGHDGGGWTGGRSTGPRGQRPAEPSRSRFVRLVLGPCLRTASTSSRVTLHRSADRCLTQCPRGTARKEGAQRINVG